MAYDANSNPPAPTPPSKESDKTDGVPTIKRVFFRLKSNGSNFSAVEIANFYLSQARLPLAKNLNIPHWIHEQPQEDKVYHIILDINPAAADPDVRIQDIPHELYRVHIRENNLYPRFERLEGQWLKIAMSYSNGYWWGDSRPGLAP